MVSRRSKRAAFGLGTILLVVATILFASARYFAAREKARRLADDTGAIRPRGLVTHALTRESRASLRRFAADIRPWMTARAAAEVPGRIVETHAEPGTRIRKGDLLVNLDPALAEAAERVAQAALAAAETEQAERARLMAEVEMLSARGAAAASDLEAARSRLRVAESEVHRAKAELERAQENLARQVIRAPFDGAVTERLVDVGDTVTPGQPVAAVAMLDSLRVVFHVSARDVAAFAVGQTVKLVPDATEGETFEPEIVAIAPAADPATRLFRVEARLPNPTGRLRGNITGTVTAQVAVAESALLIPAEAVRFRGGDASVEIALDSGEARIVPVRLGPELDGMYPVLEGLQENDRVVVR